MWGLLGHEAAGGREDAQSLFDDRLQIGHGTCCLVSNDEAREMSILKLLTHSGENLRVRSNVK